MRDLPHSPVWRIVLQCVAVWCSVVQCVSGVMLAHVLDVSHLQVWCKYPLHICDVTFIRRTDSTENDTHPKSTQSRETQMSRYKFKSKQKSNLKVYREILRTLSCSMWWILGAQLFQSTLSYVLCDV